MANDILTLALDGDVVLDDFASGMHSLAALVGALSAEVGGGLAVDWVIEDLQTGSAVATVRGVCQEPGVVDRIILAYMNVGHALERREPIPYGDEARKHAVALAGLLDGRISSVRFETASDEAAVASPASAGRVSHVLYSRGALEGVVQTLTKRRGLRFVLYDLLFDRAVSCYLREEQEAQMRDAWGRKVVVSGRIGREPVRGRAVVIRDISEIRVLEEVHPGQYRRARAIWHRQEGSESPEEVIRRLRDA